METGDTASNGGHHTQDSILNAAAQQMAQLDLVGKSLSSGNIDSPARKATNGTNVKGSTTPAEKKTPAKQAATPGSGRTSRKPSSSSAKTPDQTNDDQPLIKKVPMNKIKVGSAAASPNIKEVKSKIGSLNNVSTYKPSGGNVKIESKKLAWKAESKIGSLNNVQHQPKGGNVKIETKKVDLKNVQSRVGSLNNVGYKPGGGDKKIFDDKSFMRSAGSKTPSETISPKNSMSPQPMSPAPPANNNNNNGSLI